MNPSVLKTSGPLVATLAALLFTPAVTGAATVIDHVPYTITAPGEYMLQGDLTANGTDGIIVQAANVIINLNGFTLAANGQNIIAVGIRVTGANVIVRHGTISGFGSGVRLDASHGKAQDLDMVNNLFHGVYLTGSVSEVVNCFIDGLAGVSYGILIFAGSGDLIKSNQVVKCDFGIYSQSSNGCAFIQNYVANSNFGLKLGGHDCYQANVVTNCTTPFQGGHAIGVENGSD